METVWLLVSSLPLLAAGRRSTLSFCRRIGDATRPLLPSVRLTLTAIRAAVAAGGGGKDLSLGLLVSVTPVRAISLVYVETSLTSEFMG